MIKVVRRGNIIKAWTTPFRREDSYMPTEEEFLTDSENVLEVDLEQAYRDFPDARDRLGLFLSTEDSPKFFHIGYVTESVPNATFEVLNFSSRNSTKPILNLVDDTIEIYNFDEEQYEVDSSKNRDDFFKYGTFSFNDITQSLFYRFKEKVEGTEQEIEQILHINPTTTVSTEAKYDLSTYGGLVQAFYTLLKKFNVSDNNIKM